MRQCKSNNVESSSRKDHLPQRSAKIRRLTRETPADRGGEFWRRPAYAARLASAVVRRSRELAANLTKIARISASLRQSPRTSIRALSGNVLSNWRFSRAGNLVGLRAAFGRLVLCIFSEPVCLGVILGLEPAAIASVALRLVRDRGLHTGLHGAGGRIGALAQGWIDKSLIVGRSPLSGLPLSHP